MSLLVLLKMITELIGFVYYEKQNQEESYQGILKRFFRFSPINLRFVLTRGITSRQISHEKAFLYEKRGSMAFMSSYS